MKSKLKAQKSKQRKKLKIGVVGCGAIGSRIAVECATRLSRRFDLAAISDIDDYKVSLLKRSLKKKVPALKLGELVKRVDIVVEASNAASAAGILELCIKLRKACLIMSVGGILGNEALLEKAEAAGINVYMPSGAVSGIDALKAASVGKIRSVTLTTRKPPKGLEGAPYLVSRGMDLRSLRSETTLFEGSAAEAIKGFPANVNVSAVLSLAGIGAKDTIVRIVTSPDYTMNIHEVEIAGDSGRITTRTENVPSRDNPKTSALAIYSAIATLEGIAGSVRIGT